MDEQLNVPQEVVELFDDVVVSEKCMQDCIKSVFRAKRAIFYGRLAEKAKRKAWGIIFELYPQTKEGNWVYTPKTQKVHQVLSE